MKIYGIRNKESGIPIRISPFPNEGPDCSYAVGANFNTHKDNIIYVVNDKETAEKAIEANIKWYTSYPECPHWPPDINPKDYEVFTIEIPVTKK